MIEPEIKSTSFLYKLEKKMKPWMLVLYMLVSSISTLIVSIYLFFLPGITSGIIFGLTILLIVIIPITFLVYFYFKILRKKQENENKKEILLISRKNEETFKSRIE